MSLQPSLLLDRGRARRLAVAAVFVTALVLPPATATPLTVTIGLSPAQQCALARPKIRVPIPWEIDCYRSTWDGGSWGQAIFADPAGRYVDHIEVYLRDGYSVENTAELMGHEIAHGYVSAWARGGPARADWVADHEPYMDHFARCVTTTWAPC